MGGPVSVVFSNIYMCKLEEDIAVPAKPIFHTYTYAERKMLMNYSRISIATILRYLDY